MKKIIFISVETSFNPTHHNNQIASITKDGSLHLAISVAHDFRQDQWAIVEFGVRNFSDPKTYRTLLKYDFNLCRLFGKGRSKFLNNLALGVFDHGNMPMKCPVLKGNYSWNLDPNIFMIPVFATKNFYRLIFRTYIRQKSLKDFIGNTSVILRVTK